LSTGRDNLVEPNAPEISHVAHGRVVSAVEYERLSHQHQLDLSSLRSQLQLQYQKDLSFQKETEAKLLEQLAESSRTIQTLNEKLRILEMKLFEIQTNLSNQRETVSVQTPEYKHFMVRSVRICSRYLMPISFVIKVFYNTYHPLNHL
jgi:septal ring factor EnvC (AmiA/AmiB activator)